MENLKEFLSDKCPDSMEIYGRKLGEVYIKLYKSGDYSRGFLQGGSGVKIKKLNLL